MTANTRGPWFNGYLIILNYVPIDRIHNARYAEIAYQTLLLVKADFLNSSCLRQSKVKLYLKALINELRIACLTNGTIKTAV